MKEPNMFDDPLVDALSRVTPEVSAETKARLLYACGMAAAETRIKKHRRRYRAAAVLALTTATCLGVLLGRQLASPATQLIMSDNTQLAIEVPPPSSHRSCDQIRNETTFAAAMPLSRFHELLDRKEISDDTKQIELSTSLETPLSTLSFLCDLE